MFVQIYETAIERLRGFLAKPELAFSYEDNNSITIERRLFTFGASLLLDLVIKIEVLAIVPVHVARKAFNLAVYLGRRKGLSVSTLPHDTIATGFGPLLKLAGDLCKRMPGLK